MSAAAVEVRSFRPGDEVEINDTHNRFFGTARSLDEWAWRHPVAPEGRPIVVARRDGRLVAHLAALPLRLKLGDRELAAATVVDPFVVPEAGDDRQRAAIWAETVAAFLSSYGPGRRFDVVLRIAAGAAPGAPPTLGGDECTLPATSRLVRSRPQRPPPSRLAYRAEPARDWEPRLDGLWRRVRAQHPAAAVRDAEHALARHAGHPYRRRHRFLVLPRFGRGALGFVAFELAGDECRWLDLLWDHRRPGVLALVAHLSARLAAQLGAARESLLLGGNPETVRRLQGLGFAAEGEVRRPRLEVLACAPGLATENLADHLLLTADDLESG